jgi:hypothetical protein
MRDRGWRRWKSEVKVTKRIKIQFSRTRWFLNRDTNLVSIEHPKWFDMIGQQHIYILKSQSTLAYISSIKVKWGKKGKKKYNWSSDYFTRPKDKARFKKELQNYEY